VPPEHSEPRQKMTRTSPLTHRYPLMTQQPTRFPGGEERRVSAKEFPVSKTITGVILDMKPGALREPHWHPHANEWFYVVSGQMRAGLFGSHGRYRSEDFEQGDAGYIPQGFAHYVENTGDTTCRLLVTFDKGEYEEISLSAWLASNPNPIVADNLKASDALVERLPNRRVFIAPKEGPGK
jgi:oxalate decarboxylase